MKAVALLLSFVIATLGLVGVVEPNVLTSIGLRFASPPGLGAAAILRAGFGLIVLSVARRSRAPSALRVLGAAILFAGLVTPIVGADRARTYTEWWASQATGVLRLSALLPLAIGTFVFYAVWTGGKTQALRPAV